MKLLLDENISRRILPWLEANYPESSHVSLLGLERADDKAIWEFARSHAYVIVTKDDDFQGLLVLLGYPPKVIRLRLGNCTNQAVCDALCVNADAISATLAEPDVGLVDLC